MLAERISEHEYIDPSLIEKAAMDLKRNPERWADRGDYRQVLQELKLLWHVLVRYGSPCTPISAV
ncbi:DUF3626 domain-containing protein [Pseudobacteriovorax antillogorgiicola]|uniref:DUF3626 domain-containing protein n=1 Tax=Pseudobacteriovorax antillogorgiicola TaxID=1513793 RepID=UPI00104906AD